MKDIAVYGAGGLGREVALLITQINEQQPTWKVIGFFDDNLDCGTIVDELSVLGGIEELNTFDKTLSVVVAIASPSSRQSIVGKINNEKVDFPPIIHPQSNIGSSRNYFGRGCIITEGCIFTTGIRVEDFVLINLASTIGHDVVLEQFTSVMPGCHISGNVKVGETSLIGSGACILQNLSLGACSIVGAGAVVTKSFPAHSKLVGVPATNIVK